MINQKLIDNIAAVSAEFHTDKRYQEFYDRYADQLSGFPGIWTFCAFAGTALRNVEVRLDMIYDGEWIETVEGYVDRIYKECLGDNPPSDLQDMKWLESVAEAVIVGHATATPSLAPVELHELRFIANGYFSAGVFDEVANYLEYMDSDDLKRVIDKAERVLRS